MKSLAYLVAFILACVVIGGPISLVITYIRTVRRRTTIMKSALAILLGLVSVFLSLILVINTGGLVSKVLGLIGLATGIPAIVKSFRTVRNIL
jgi:ABC-type spermidine/putrescine transport system permease subunit I